MDNSNNDEGFVWKRQLREHLSTVRLSDTSRDSLEALLLSGEPDSPVELVPSVARQSFPNVSTSRRMPLLARFHRSGAGYVATAVVAAAVSFFWFGQKGVETALPDAVTELAFSHISNLPADFDLEGNPDLFPGILEEVYPQDTFATHIPADIRQNFVPSEGRFFAWAGLPGVIINLNERALTIDGVSTAQPLQTASLYIVKLNTNTAQHFPEKRVVRDVKSKSGDGSNRRVATWREGPYGYALVSSVVSSLAAEEIQTGK